MAEHEVIYISGSITDDGTLPPDEIASRIEAFHDLERRLLAHGYGVLNPARHGSDPSKTWHDYMRMALVDISQATGLAMIDGWEKSRGARAEHAIAGLLDIPTKRAVGWLP